MALQYGCADTFTVTLEGPFGSAGSAVRLTQLYLPAQGWRGAISPYSQAVELERISRNSKVDLLPDYQQLECFRHQELAFLAENEDGAVTVYAIGDKPEEDLVFQAAITEVIA